MRYFVIAGLCFAVLGVASPADFVREAEALSAVRYERPNLERMIALYETALAHDPHNKELLIQLAQLWYEWAVLVPEGEDEPGWWKAADYAFRAMGLEGLDHALKLSNAEFQALLARAEDGRPLLWAAHGWGQLLGKMNPFSAFFALPKIRALYERAMELAPTYMAGSAFQAYGALLANLSDYGLIFGVRLEEARPYFEKALEIDPTYLDHYVAYAKEYAVRAKNRTLFEQLLAQVLEAPVGHWTFWNRVAKDRAQELLAQASRLFR